MTAPGDMDDALNLVRGLIETRTFKKERLDAEDVRRALITLGDLGASVDNPQLRLTAVSLLGKAGEVSKPIAQAVGMHLKRALDVELPPVGDWGNAEERYYLAKAVETSDAGWISRYAAEALAQAEISEKLSRDKWAELAINRAETLAGALRTIAGALREWLVGRDETTDLAYRKLVRICEALTQTLVAADVPTGEAFGEAFVALVRLAGGGKGSETRRVREEAAVSVLDLVIQTLRLRFDILFDSNIYRAAGTVRSWWRPARPPGSVESRADRIAGLAMQGLHVLARQGVRDQELRRALTTALDPDRVNTAGQRIATADVSLEPRSSKWLATGQELVAARSNAGAQELNDQATDELLARLMLTVTSHDVSPDALASVADAIELFEPAQAATVRRAGDRLGVVRQWVDALAGKRRLSTYGSRAEVVQYDPALHEAKAVVQRLSEVRIALPGVLQSPEGRPPTIVIKAVVEKI